MLIPLFFCNFADLIVASNLVTSSKSHSVLNNKNKHNYSLLKV